MQNILEKQNRPKQFEGEFRKSLNQTPIFYPNFIELPNFSVVYLMVFRE